jgi:hypothetical protein
MIPFPSDIRALIDPTHASREQPYVAVEAGYDTDEHDAGGFDRKLRFVLDVDGNRLRYYERGDHALCFILHRSSSMRISAKKLSSESTPGRH